MEEKENILAQREGRLLNLILTVKEWQHADIQDVLLDMMTDIIVLCKSEGISPYEIYRDGIGDYAYLTDDESIFDEI